MNNYNNSNNKNNNIIIISNKKKNNRYINRSPTHRKKYYCICQQDYDESKPMIACDNCQEWYHFSCIGLSESRAAEIDKFICPIC
ncbi:hypothetical protein LY90DRAFT_419284, partial [Neocallimastix californiae]